jgi:hypothetical protein
MNLFTEVYSSLISLLQTQSLAASWTGIEAELKALCQNDGPSETKKESLQKARDKIENAAGILDYLSFNSSSAYADEILKAAQTANVGFQKRAAMLKTFKHFYFVAKKGNQSIWVVDHPKAYTTWAFDQLEGKSEKDVKALLQKEEEVFGPGNRNMMSDALQLARKWSMDIVVKLGNADADTLAIVKRWFHNDADSELQVKATVAILLGGFKKISDACNSTTVIFSDRPHKRVDPTSRAVASVNVGDVMPVIYIFQTFLDRGKRDFFGNIPMLWRCSMTVIHELSHKLQSTKDKSYGWQGLKPGSSITASDAVINADSWAYFAANLVGVLTQGTIDDVLK